VEVGFLLNHLQTVCVQTLLSDTCSVRRATCTGMYLAKSIAQSGSSRLQSSTSCARGDTICTRPSLPPWAPQRLARRRADAT